MVSHSVGLLVAWSLDDLCVIAFKVSDDESTWVSGEAICLFHYIWNLSEESPQPEEQKSQSRAERMIRLKEPLTV